MRKTSQDGGDSTSVTSGVENENKKPKAGLLLEFKSKKIGKRTAPNLSEESDDAVVEPLLQKTIDKTTQSAKYFAKAKADTVKEISKLFNDKKSQYATTSNFGTTETLLSEKDQAVTKPNPSSNVPLRNHMNVNVFHTNSSQPNTTTKSQLLVEIDGSMQNGYNPSPLIFTTAKIHTDGKSKHMEPVQMTPAPILSTVEVNVTKGGNITTINEKKVSNGTSVMNTACSQVPANEKAKENIVLAAHSNVTPVTRIKENTMVDNTTNLNKITTIPKSPLEIKSLLATTKAQESATNNSNSKQASSLVQNNVINDKVNSSKPLIQSTLSNNASEIGCLPETSKTSTVDVKKNIIKGTNDNKKHDSEPRIIMSESKLKSTVSDTTNTVTSVNIAKTPLEPTKVLESAMKQPQINQSDKQEKHKSENNTNIDRDSNIKKMDIIDSKQTQNKKDNTIVHKNDIISNTTKSLSLQKNTPAAQVSAVPLKTETKSSVSKNLECSADPSAKTFSSSTKTPTPSNVIDSKLGKEIDKSPKPSANVITKPISKVSLNNTATSANKIPTSAIKPAHSVSSSNVVSSGTDATKKTVNESSVNNSKATASTSATITTSSIAIKNQSSITKTANTTANTKATSVPSTKSSTKPSSASSTKSPNSSIPVTKQPNTSTKTGTGKPPSLALTKTPQVNISSPIVTTPVSKPTVSKIAQVSTSNPVGPKARSVAASSTTADTSNKTKVPESKKVGSKLSDHAKDTKVSKT